ncbi:hypothetical protein NOCARDAX2BIS_260003 [Nocardioides sp. AX2bis]|nr:hypothetical protein NOCARDAX2BIS_260003 [Nocardioides sp. AX2bis]
MHQQRRGHRPAPGRAGRLRDRHRRCLARDRGHAGPAAQRARRRAGCRAQRPRRARRPPCLSQDRLTQHDQQCPPDRSGLVRGLGSTC